METKPKCKKCGGEMKREEGPFYIETEKGHHVRVEGSGYKCKNCPDSDLVPDENLAVHINDMDM